MQSVTPKWLGGSDETGEEDTQLWHLAGVLAALLVAAIITAAAIFL